MPDRIVKWEQRRSPFSQQLHPIVVDLIGKLSVGQLPILLFVFIGKITGDRAVGKVAERGVLEELRNKMRNPVFVFGSLYLAGGIRQKLIDFYKNF